MYYITYLRHDADAGLAFLCQQTWALQWRHNGRDCVSNRQRLVCLLSRLFRRRSKKISKLRDTGLGEENSPMTGEFPAQMACNAQNVSIWWRHHIESSESWEVSQGHYCEAACHIWKLYRHFDTQSKLWVYGILRLGSLRYWYVSLQNMLKMINSQWNKMSDLLANFFMLFAAMALVAWLPSSGAVCIRDQYLTWLHKENTLLFYLSIWLISKLSWSFDFLITFRQYLFS